MPQSARKPLAGRWAPLGTSPITLERFGKSWHFCALWPKGRPESPNYHGRLWSRGMAITISKLLALLIAAAYCLAALLLGATVGQILILLAAMALPLALIWFPERLGTRWPSKKTRLGAYEDVSGRGGASYRDSPPALVAFMGWFFLVGLPILLYFISRLRVSCSFCLCS